jgi:hypothetical protein
MPTEKTIIEGLFIMTWKDEQQKVQSQKNETS